MITESVRNALSQKLEVIHLKNKSDTLIVWFPALAKGPKLAKIKIEIFLRLKENYLINQVETII
jgi:hypothetical protein